MLKVLLVDDETIFRKGLRSMIAAMGSPWEVVGEAKDGLEALDRLETLLPDVLLTDIRMPRMDGIQLLQLAVQRYPQLQCVVVSGYDEFAYVQQSLRLGVKDYLLKPVDREQLAAVLHRLRDGFGTETPVREVPKTPKEDIEIKQYVREHLISGLLRGTVNEADLALLQKVGVQWSLACYTCMIVKLDKSSVDEQRYLQADPSLFLLYIQQFVSEVLNRKVAAFCFVLSDTEVVALVNTDGTEEDRVRLFDLAESIRRGIKALSQMTVTIGVGKTVMGVESIPQTYNEAAVALLYRLILGGDKVLDYEQTAAERENARQSAVDVKSWDELEQAVREGREESAAEKAETVVHELCRRMTSPEMIYQQVCKLVIQYYEFALELQLVQAWLGERDIRTVLVEICSISSREELVEHCRSLFARLACCVGNAEGSREHDPILAALRYMEKHYAEPLTLRDVADRAFLNPAYFSTQFKLKTGMSFTEKLTNLRLAEAKRNLLYSEDKVAVIAERIGFSNVRHFNRVFKQETGLSPKDFRERMRRRHDHA